MLISRNPTTARGERYTIQIKAVERNTTKHITPLKSVRGVKGRCFNLLSDLRGVQTSIFNERLENLPSAIRYFNVIWLFPKLWTSITVIA
ncbi:putative 1-acyl-sn-glycerol-3-phosphate acyltransferase [Trifolium repens]|nr:putative 1-acyl-sn-glycerol-3-phosphate acyltransferase [Trifolium repens]